VGKTVKVTGPVTKAGRGIGSHRDRYGGRKRQGHWQPQRHAVAVTEEQSEIEAVRGRYIGSHRCRDKGWQKPRQRKR
jgi:hypothetical protein